MRICGGRLHLGISVWTEDCSDTFYVNCDMLVRVAKRKSGADEMDLLGRGVLPPGEWLSIPLELRIICALWLKRTGYRWLVF